MQSRSNNFAMHGGPVPHRRSYAGSHGLAERKPEREPEHVAQRQPVGASERLAVGFAQREPVGVAHGGALLRRQPELAPELDLAQRKQPSHADSLNR